MSHAYRERPSQPNWKRDEIDWAAPRQWKGDDGGLWLCWPVASEPQMWEQAMCHACGRPARWVGLASPFGDGQQYFAEFDSWCYWCFPRHNLTGEAQRLACHADWARQQTVEECIRLIDRFRVETDDAGKADAALSRLANEVRHALTPKDKTAVVAL